MLVTLYRGVQLEQDNEIGRGIRGTQVEPYIQDIVDEVAPIKEAPLWD